MTPIALKNLIDCSPGQPGGQSRRQWIYRTLTCILWAALLMPTSQGHAQSMPVEFGVAQHPYILILMDTSGSKQWTTQGNEAYPTYEPPLSLLSSHKHLDTWEAGDRIHYNSDAPYETVGPCFVWRPECPNYFRPGWCAENGCPWYDNYSPAMQNKIEGAAVNMREDEEDWKFRLLNDNQKPRHILFKEILAGDMILFPPSPSTTDPSFYNSEEHGPGCWFVPRMGYTTVEDDKVCGENQTFRNHLDFAEPRPHYQEVYDVRKNNGVLYKFGHSAIFSVAMIDGYQYANNSLSDSNWPFAMNDIIAGESPLGASNSEDNVWDCKNNGSNLQCYNFGIHRLVGPFRFDLTRPMREASSTFAQLALLGAGYVHLDDGVDHTLDPASPWGWLNINFPDDFEDNIEPYVMGKQPVAAASPHAAAFHDVHQYFREGQKSVLDPAEVKDPFRDDPYNKCRPKHVILITDVHPEPEVTGGAGASIGSEVLSPPYYDEPDLFKYELTETHITDLVTDEAGIGFDPENPRFIPRVHVVGMLIEYPEPKYPAGYQDRVVEKLSVMAESGNSCAQYYLPTSLIQPGYENREGDDGECNPTEKPCLVVPATYPGYTFPFDDSGEGFECKSPAFIFTQDHDVADCITGGHSPCSVREVIRGALERLLNEVVGASGLASRTRPVMTSYLDDPDDRQGQYRIYSGVLMEGTNLYWKGLLNRQTLPCAIDPTDGVLDEIEMRALHNDINWLLHDIEDRTDDPPENLPSFEGDRRRVFTTVPHQSVYSLAANKSIGSTSNLPYVSNFTLADIGETFDEFHPSYVAPSPPSEHFEGLHGTRIPFNKLDLYEAYLAAHGYLESDTESYFKVLDTDHLTSLIHEVRGRIEEKADRVLNGILSSNPVIVSPPNLDLPVDSYRAFRKEFRDRATMLYVGTLDGQLHAIYTGTPSVPAREFLNHELRGNSIVENGTDVTAMDQREAWAYIPHMLHRRLAEFRNTQPRLLDGSPIVSDIRLCHAKQDYNFNTQACNNDFWSGSGGDIPHEGQWRTVLLQSLGDAGSGLFAMDITRPGFVVGAKVYPPDPIPLWEFDRTWERGQLETLWTSTNDWAIKKTAGNTFTPTGCTEEEYFTLPFLGTSFGEPAIGTVAFKPNIGTTNVTHRAIALVPGGSPQGITESIGDCDDEENPTGKAIFILDMQTGSILRRFVDYEHESAMHMFDSPLIGSAALYDDTPGSLATRGFIGDAKGRLFRIDLTNPSPDEWKVHLFFDPDDSEEIDAYDEDIGFGPASYRPAVVRGSDYNLVVVYGLGERGDTTTAGQTQAMIAVEETITASGIEPNLLWVHRFEELEKLTGEPVVFNHGVYFTSYVVDDLENVCLPGYSRIYGLKFEGSGIVGDFSPVGVIDPDVEDEDGGIVIDGSNDPPLWFGPQLPSLIRGVSITLGPNCSVVFDDVTGEPIYRDQAPRKPQLIAHVSRVSGSADAFDSLGGDSGLGDDAIGRIAIDLRPPRSQTMPMSWSVIHF